VYGHPPPGSTVKGGLIILAGLMSRLSTQGVPQLHKTFTEAVSFKNLKAKVLPASFVAFVSPGDRKKRRNSDAS